jgi:hypothetical protein
VTSGRPWRWAWISITGLRFLGIYGRDDHGFVFHAVVDLAATPADQIRNHARDANYQAQAMWRLGAHEEVTVDERLPPQLRILKRRSYEEATADQTVVLVLEPGEVGHFDLPEMH